MARFFSYFRYIICKDYAKNHEKIGGEDDVVEIDESLCGKLKYGRGDPSKRRRTWVFGGVSRVSGKAFALVCPNNKRTKAVLFPIIQAKIKPKTMIYSDGWKPYRKIPTLGFGHKWVDHSKFYVHPTDRNLHTNTIEGMWGTMKRFFPNAGPYNLEQYITMFLWFRKLKAEGKDPFWALVELISQNNTREVFEAAQNVEDDQEGFEYDEEEDNVESDEEDGDDESSDSETDDDGDAPFFSCPFCQRIFEEKQDVLDHIDVNHQAGAAEELLDREEEMVDEMGMQEEEEEEQYCCPFCPEVYQETNLVIDHISLSHDGGEKETDGFTCPYCELDLFNKVDAFEHVNNCC